MKRAVAALVGVLGLLVCVFVLPVRAESGLQAVSATLTCTGSPCPYGATYVTNAIVWPDTLPAVNTLMGYTADYDIFLQSDLADGVSVIKESGAMYGFINSQSAEVGSWTFSGSTEYVLTAQANQSDYFVWVIGDASQFVYTLNGAPAPTTTTTTTTTTTIPETTTTEPATTTTEAATTTTEAATTTAAVPGSVCVAGEASCTFGEVAAHSAASSLNVLVTLGIAGLVLAVWAMVRRAA